MQETPVQFLGWKIRWRRNRLPIPVFLGFLCGSAGKESDCNVGDPGSIPELGKFPGEEKGYPLQYSGLANSMDCIVHGVAKSQTHQVTFPFTYIVDLQYSLVSGTQQINLVINSFLLFSIIGYY